MQDNHNNERFLSNLIQKGKLEMPFSDFEETVMHRIQKENLLQAVASRDRKLSTFFFVLGTSLGLILNTILGRSKFTLLNIPSNSILLVFQVGFVLLFLVQFDISFSFIREWKKTKKSLG